MTETFTKLSKAGSTEMLQLRTKGVVAPAYVALSEVDRDTVGMGTAIIIVHNVSLINT